MRSGRAASLAVVPWVLMLVSLIFAGAGTACLSQPASFALGTLDPTRNLPTPAKPAHSVAPLPEQYIWLSEPERPQKSSRVRSRQKTYFRSVFSLETVPHRATFYIAGPLDVIVYVNGAKVLDRAGATGGAADSSLRSPVFTADVTDALRPGKNTVAIDAGSGWGADSRFVAKIVPAARGIGAAPILVTNGGWRATNNATEGWEKPGFDDAAWLPVKSFGAINGNIEFLQGNEDSGLYDWPGYTGVSSFLARYPLPPARITNVIRGTSQMQNVESLLLADAPSGQEFTVRLSAPTVVEQNAPSIVLDFGKEVAGWVELKSDSNVPAMVTVQYGESMGELEHQPYLGVDPLYIPAHGTAHGPKSAFRYAKVRFVGATAPLRFEYIRLNGIYYPVKYRGSFSSSDALLNRIWEVGAYTAHLCMQDDIWDAPKRDRMRWMGDLDVSGDVIDSVFLDHFLMQDTLTRLIGPAPIDSHVNSIPGYSAFWVMGMMEYYRHTGQATYLRSMRDRLVGLLKYMEGDLGPDHRFDNPRKAWPFVDWSPNLEHDTPEARMATDFEYYAAFSRGSALLKALGDEHNAARFEAVAANIKQAAQSAYWNSASGDFGPRWQTNAMAIYSGVANPDQYGDIWTSVLSKVGTPFYNALIITPYYNYYVITAMAETGHRRQALEWIRKYWGGMIAEGATSFWEGYDPSWYKRNFHASLQADDGTGYFVSLAHGWSSGPTAWLMEQILGIHPTAAGFSRVTIRPDLAGLAWAKGTEPTPNGPIRVDLRAAENGSEDRAATLGTFEVDLPPGVNATVLVPVAQGHTRVLVDGNAVEGKAVEDGRRVAINLDRTGRFRITTE